MEIDFVFQNHTVLVSLSITLQCGAVRDDESKNTSFKIKYFHREGVEFCNSL
jgi:hypothetical protein